jgi:hypothetical protein
MTKQEILKTHKMTEKEFYKKFPTLEAYNQFQMGGSLSPKQKFQGGGFALPVDPSVMQNITKTVPTFGNGAGGAVGASAGGAASGLGSAAGPAASAISAVPELIQGAKQPSGPEKGKAVGKTIGSTAGGIGGAIAGSILLPGVGTVIGGMLGSTLGGMAGGGIGKMVGNQNQEFKQETNQFKMGGDFTDFKGYTHEDGGVTFPGTNIEVEKNETKAKLPDGRKVIFTNSNEIPYKGKRTYAQEHRSIEKKYFRNDLTDMNTKKRLIPKLFEDQEMKKEQKQAMMLTDLKNQYMMYGGKLRMAPGGEINYNYPMSEDRTTSVAGGSPGYIKPKSFAAMPVDLNPKPFLAYPTGPKNTKDFQDWMDVNNPTWYKGAKFSENPDYKGYYGTYGSNTQNAYKNFSNDYEIMIGDQQRRKDLNLTPMPRMGITKPDDLNPKINDKMLDVPDFYHSPGKSKPKVYDGPSYANLAAQSLGDAYNIGRGLKGPDPVDFERVKPSFMYADPKPAITAMNNATSTSFNNARNSINNSGAGRAERLTFLTQTAGQESLKRGLGEAQIKSEYDKMNTNTYNSIANQAKSQNAQIQMAESEARQKEQDAARSSISTGLSGLGSKVGGFNSAKSSWNNQNDLLSLMRNKGFYPVEGKDGKMMWKKDGVNVPYEVGITSAFGK